MQLPYVSFSRVGTHAIGSKISSGEVMIIDNIDSPEVSNFKDGDVLVTKITDPDWEPIMKKASAIITEKGGRTCHAAIVARELRISASTVSRILRSKYIQTPKGAVSMKSLLAS